MKKLVINFPFIKYSLQVIIMFAFLSKAFAFSSAPHESIKLKPRQINLSGEILSFSMPENFSIDMPADDMIESINLADESVFEDYQKYTLIRRWWDFKEKGFFAKNYGSVMMAIYIKRAPENSDYSILNPLEFVGTLIRNFDEMSRKEKLENNNVEPSTLYPNFYETYMTKTINSLHWFRYPIEEKIIKQYIVNYAIPITPQHYIEVRFTLLASNNLSTRQFLSDYGRPHMDAIMDTFTIQFSPKSKLPSINSQPIDLDKLIKEKFHAGQEPVIVNEELLNSIKHIRIE